MAFQDQRQDEVEAGCEREDRQGSRRRAGAPQPLRRQFAGNAGRDQRGLVGQHGSASLAAGAAEDSVRNKDHDDDEQGEGDGILHPGRDEDDGHRLEDADDEAAHQRPERIGKAAQDGRGKALQREQRPHLVADADERGDEEARQRRIAAREQELEERRRRRESTWTDADEAADTSEAARDPRPQPEGRKPVDEDPLSTAHEQLSKARAALDLSYAMGSLVTDEMLERAKREVELAQEKLEAEMSFADRLKSDLADVLKGQPKPKPEPEPDHDLEDDDEMEM